MNGQLIGKLARIAALAALMHACVPPPPQDYNSPAFARRAPAPGHATYFETLKFIDDGLKYANSAAAFYVSPDGRMCFRDVSNLKTTIFDNLYQGDWCLSPTAVSRVETAPNIVTGMSDLQLSCKHADPQCIREISNSNRVANSVTLAMVRPDQGKIAFEHLIYLMGGNLGDNQPFKSPAPTAISGSAP